MRFNRIVIIKYAKAKTGKKKHAALLRHVLIDK